MSTDNMPFNEILRLSGFWTWIVVLSILAGCGGMNVGGGADATGLGHCAAAARLVPDFTVHNPTGPGYREYNTNATQYNAICLPETWHFMQDKWQGLRSGVSQWPIVVVIDDGFFSTDDSGVRPEIHPGYPDGSAVHPQGSAWGDTPQPGQVTAYGHHGTAVLSLLASRANNALLVAGVCGPWSNVPRGGEWGAHFLPVRIGRGLSPAPTPTLLAQIFNDVVFSLNQIRVVNISKTLVDVNLPDGSELESRIRWANARQVVIVTGAGNERGTVEADRWVRRFENVIVVGALNPDGADFWVADSAAGTATGPGVDIYAPGEDLTVIEALRSTQKASGTSFATPLVSGVVAMMLNLASTLDPWEVRDILVKTVITPTSGGTAVPRLNAYRAVLCASALQRSSTAALPGGASQPVRYWSCDMGALGSASGSRIGF